MESTHPCVAARVTRIGTMPTTHSSSSPRYHKLHRHHDSTSFSSSNVASEAVMGVGESVVFGGILGHRRTAAATTTAVRATAGGDDDATTVTVHDGMDQGGGLGVDGAGTAAPAKTTTTTTTITTTAGASSAAASERLWSNLNVAKEPFRHEPGSLPGAIALVAGTTVGAGMLALPAVCQDSGFVPSTTALIGCWTYMVATGLLVLEVNLSTMCELGSGGVSIISMAERTLGKPGTRFAWGAYVFIHYALLVAYISRSGGAVTAAAAAAEGFSALFIR